jgi:hypothetical protein
MKTTIRASLFNSKGDLLHFEDVRFDLTKEDDGVAAKAAVMRLMNSASPYPGDTIKIVIKG